MQTVQRYAVLFIISINFVISESSVVDAKNAGSGVPHKEESKGKNSGIAKTFLFNGSYVYLEDVLFVLKNQNWTQEEQPCLQQTLFLLRNLQNFTLWAVWNWDSIPAEPQGLLYGSRFQLGNYDECMDAPWYEDHEELRAQYCLAEIVLERTNKNAKKRKLNPYDPHQSALNLLEYIGPYERPLNQLTWGVCVPAVCEKQSVTRLMGILLAHSHLGTAGLKANVAVSSCEKTNQRLEYDALFYSFIALTVGLLAIAVISTNLNKGSKYSNFVTKAFDINENAKNLLKFKKEGIEVLYGIRFFTICVIVIAHQFGMSNSGPMSNGYTIDKQALSVYGMFLLHNDLSVDTFFWLSGFLTANIFTRIKRIPSLPIALIKRYIRLAIAYAYVIFFTTSVFPYMGSGPLWKSYREAETGTCRKNWWVNLLMLNNYVDTHNLCLIVTWYISCDFHFYIVTLLMYWVYTKSSILGRTGMMVLMVAAIITPGFITYLYKLPPVQLFTYNFMVDPRRHEQFHLTYIKSHTRYGAYLVGFLTGHIFVYYSTKQKTITQKWATIGAGAGIILMGAVLFSGPPFLWRGYTVAESVIYAALNRPIWAISISIFVLSCAFGHVPLLKSFFSWHVWVPLSRLAYGLYLVHSLLIIRNVAVSRNPQHNDYLRQFTSAFGVIIVGCLASLLIWLLAEAPFNNLSTYIFSPRKIAPLDAGKPETHGHLQDNLPPSIDIVSSSKI
ncbi:nose resistant to fluoxetine protein 6-like [Pieris napi]|uniref:nose resistant to fluoxetine protein 6-like n=1 Tax=Pieris napi TaxID=78633 RepID=UPI001FB93111|nr:nose resistant to fluoxetine protein 6-like [Pieris napi]